MKHIHAQSGFSLVETLVAITILLIVMIGPMTISSKSAQTSSFSSEQVTAFFLAQEGVELALKARDDLLIRSFISNVDSAYVGNPWFTFTYGTKYANCYTTEGCRLEIVTRTGTMFDQISPASPRNIARCTGINCQLYRTTATNIRSKFTYVSTGSVPTPYTRSIRFIRIPDISGNINEVLVLSEVRWQNSTARNRQTVVVESRLLNVYGR